jgi:hypothetical protein
MLRRETIIALRARHTAFRIAVDILYPPQPQPQPPMPEPPMPILEDGEQARADWQAAAAKQAARERTGRVLAIVFGAFTLAYLLLIVYAVYLAQNPPPPPPPQGQPILPADR